MEFDSPNGDFDQRPDIETSCADMLIMDYLIACDIGQKGSRYIEINRREFLSTSIYSNFDNAISAIRSNTARLDDQDALPGICRHDSFESGFYTSLAYIKRRLGDDFDRIASENFKALTDRISKLANNDPIRFAAYLEMYSSELNYDESFKSLTGHTNITSSGPLSSLARTIGSDTYAISRYASDHSEENISYFKLGLNLGYKLSK